MSEEGGHTHTHTHTHTEREKQVVDHLSSDLQSSPKFHCAALPLTSLASSLQRA